MLLRRTLATLLLVVPLAGVFAVDEPKKPVDPVKKPIEPAKVDESELKDFKTVKTAVKADPKSFKTDGAAKSSVPGFAGIEVLADKAGLPVVGEIAPGSPALDAGFKTGDVLKKIGDDAVRSVVQAKDHLRGLPVGEKLAVVVERAGKAIALTVTPKAASKPMSNASSAAPARAVMGVMSGDVKKTGGVEISEVTTGGGADKAGVKAGDIVLSIDEKKIDEATGLRAVLESKKPGDLVKLAIKRGEKDLELRVTLQGDSPNGTRPGGASGWDDRLPNAWKRKDYKLAVIGIEYQDVKHNDKIDDKDWETSLFSFGKYTDKSATGQKVHGSMADYYKDISYDVLKIEGKFAGWVEVAKKRTEYSTGSGVATREKTSLLTEAMDKLLAKDKDALKDMDGVFFLFAGGPVPSVTRGSLYWPHRASVSHNNKRWPYFIVSELSRVGGMMDISVFCHEFGHMLGLPDLYARPEVPGMEGVGSWCAMSQQVGNGRPQHFSAWSKEQLGWIKPAMIDPRVKQKLILAPIEDSNGECFKVPIKADGSEYLLLENRKKKGWDTELPAEGLLIWRVMPGNVTQRVFLEESHGVAGPSGPRSFTGAVPFPSPSNDSFTPFTTPSSKSQTGGGYEVFITNIKRLPDGRVSFQIGYEFQ